MTVVPKLDYLLMERVLSGSQPVDRLNPKEKCVYEKYKPGYGS